MTEHNKADQARKGLIDSVKGKAKEIAGAVTGNDSLTAEGQLEQTQAQQRKEANSVEAVADAEAAQAHADATKAKLEGAEERIAVSAKTAAVQNSVRTEQAAQHRAAEQAGQRDAARAKTQAERDAQRAVERAKAEERERSRRRCRGNRRRRRRTSDLGAGGNQRPDGSRPHQTAGRQFDQTSRPALSSGKTQELLNGNHRRPIRSVAFSVPARPVPASVNRGAGGRWDEFGSPYTIVL